MAACHKPELYRNDWMDQASFWHGDFFALIYGVLQGNSDTSKNKGTSCGTMKLRAVLAQKWLEKLTWNNGC